MAEDRAYLVDMGIRYPIRVSVPGRRSRRTSGRHNRPRPVARHRLGGGPHLRHCGQLPAVGKRLTAKRRAAARGTNRRVPTSVVLLLLVAGFTAVSGWLAASGAVAFAGMIH